jgi:hypothetical protein
MIKMMIYVFATIFAITLVRIFIGIIAKGLGASLGATASGSTRPGGPDRSAGHQTNGSQRGGVLRKDSLTGIYLAEEIAITKVINGRKHYFASEENFREYLKRTPTSA